MNIRTVVLGFLLIFISDAYAAPAIKVKSLDPKNFSYLNEFCNFHPNSGLCYFTTNPVPKPPYTPPGPPPTPGPPPGPLPPPGKGITLCYPPTGTPKPACGQAALTLALSKAKPGDNITLCGGIYGGTYNYNTAATEGAPVVIKPATSLPVKFTGTFNMNGSYGVLAGVEFDKGKMTMNGHHNRVTKSKFYDLSGNAIEMAGAQHAYNRIDHNEFRDFQGAAVRADGITNTHNHTNAANHRGHRIDNNYFKNHSRLGINESVLLMLTDSFTDMYLTYENNVFDDVLNNIAGQAELTTIKTAGTRFIGNTVINSPKAEVSVRESNRTVVENNCLKDGAGISVHGDDNVISSNRVEGGGKIDIRGGDCTMDCKQCVIGDGSKNTATILKGSRCVTAHTAVRRAVVKNNIGRIVVGDTYSGANVPAQNVRLENNSGPITYQKHTGTIVVNGTPANTAYCLAPTQVGPGVPDTSCPGS